jgi:hypothetical protein
MESYKKFCILMQSFFPSQQTLPDSVSWPSASTDFHAESSPPPTDAKDGLRARNRIAAKRWRDKKDDTLYHLESINDQLRREALDFRRQLLMLQTENHMLEDELRFFQSFMTQVMNVTSRQTGPLPPPWVGHL